MAYQIANPSTPSLPVAADAGTGQPRRLLAICWNDPTDNAPAAAALGRRVRQIANGFVEAGWSVDVLFRATDARSIQGTLDGRVHSIAVPGPGFELSRPESLPIIRMMATYWYARRLGDRSGRWARVASGASKRVSLPDAAIAFFTPRGPLAVAARLHRSLGVPWLADLQDPIDEGASGSLRSAVVAWMRATLRTAARVVQVSPEWAHASSEALARTVDVLRHAVPDPPLPEVADAAPQSEHSSRRFTILYAGSLNFEFQSVVPLLRAVERVNREYASHMRSRVVLRLASTRELFDRVHSLMAPDQAHAVEWAGWLSPQDLAKAIRAADALALVPWSGRDRHVVPSKLYEYLAYERPVLVAGADSGGVRTLLRDLQHPDVVADDADRLVGVLRDLLRGDTRGAITADACRVKPCRESDLQRQYLAWVSAIVNPHT